MIDAQLAQFLQEGLAIHIGTRNEQLEPNGARAAALTVDEDGSHVVVYVAKIAAARVLSDLESNGLAAISVARPTDDRACQLKGTFVGSRLAKASERALVARQFDGFVETLEHIGIPRLGTQNWITWPAVAIRLRITALFDQTPGANAGAPLA
jgi:hypothetical protein